MAHLLFDSKGLCTQLLRFLTFAEEIGPIEDRVWFSPFVSLRLTCRACDTVAKRVLAEQHERAFLVEHSRRVAWRGAADLQLLGRY